MTHLHECHGFQEAARENARCISELKAEVERLKATLESQGRDHDARKCPLGSLCPWCEVERLKEVIREIRDDHEPSEWGDVIRTCNKALSEEG